MRAQSLGARLAQARREMGVREHRDITRAEVAAAAGVEPSAVTQWEKDQKDPREDALARAATFLGVTPAYLRYGVPANAHHFTPEEVAENTRQADKLDAARKRRAKPAPKRGKAANDR